MKNSTKGPAGKLMVDEVHRELGQLLWDDCGMSRNRQGLEHALETIPGIRERFWNNLYLPGESGDLNQSLERAGRVADFLEFSEFMVRDALAREESCGCHLREESQTEDHEALRNDEHYSHVSVWEYQGRTTAPVHHREPLVFENVTPTQRSYK